MRLFKNKKLAWYPLDNAGKIYPPTASETRPQVFSFSAIICDEVNPEILRVACQNVLEHYPTFKTQLKRGLFWYFLEENPLPIKIFKETPNYLGAIQYKDNNGYLFQLLYVRNKITIKIFHALTDGTGGFAFFSEIICEYLKLSGYNFDTQEKIKPIDAPISGLDSDDSFLTYENNPKIKSEKIPKPFKIGGTPFEYDGAGQITAILKVDDIKKVCKKLGVTITSYLAALYQYSIYKTTLENRPLKNKIVSVLVPCNLRKHYGGDTNRNFTMFARVIIDWNKQTPTLEECALIAQEQIKDGLKKEKLDKIIHDNVKTEKNFFVKLVPLFLKDIIMRLIYVKVGENLQTVDLSNIGQVNLPDGLKNFVKHITFCIAPTYTCAHQTGVIGYNDNLYITFTRNYIETGVEKTFVRELTKQNIPVTICSNYWESKI